jgi:hypothetical protein
VAFTIKQALLGWACMHACHSSSFQNSDIAAQKLWNFVIVFQLFHVAVRI